MAQRQQTPLQARWTDRLLALALYRLLWLAGRLPLRALHTLGAGIGWLMLRYSRKLPFGTFFGISAMLVAVLAVVLAGKGVAALQEAGWLSMSLFDGPRVDLLGIHPTVEGIGLQLAVVAVLVVGFMWNMRQARLAR